MKDVRDRVAVVTGAASGIGRALAERFCAAGMKVVLSDVEVDALQQATAALREQGASVHAAPADVASAEQVRALAQETLRVFGAVHVVCNNAGVFEPGTVPSWRTSADDWSWILGVNLMGVVHGVQAFMPILQEQAVEAHIVNTASIGGWLAGNPLYSVTKFGVVALTEALYVELRRAESKVGVSLLCPGYVKTALADSERNRPAQLPERSPSTRGREMVMRALPSIDRCRYRAGGGRRAHARGDVGGSLLRVHTRRFAHGDRAAVRDAACG